MNVETNYDIDLRSSGSGWMGTYAKLLRAAVRSILDDRESWPDTEVTLHDGTVLTGTLRDWMDDDTFTITEPDALPRVVEVDDVLRFRA